MPHNLYDWTLRIKATEREFREVWIAVDWLLSATIEEIHDIIAEKREWDDLAAADTYACDKHLELTYLIRMFSVFERAIISYWRLLPGNGDREERGNVRLDQVGAARVILQDIIDDAQAVGLHRNKLVHGRIEDHYLSMTLVDARAKLLTFLGRLPKEWG